MQYTQHTGLPEPDQDHRAHSRRVIEYISQQMARSGGSISFAEFMQHALYAPGLGYYATGATKFGPGGDFVTAPEISPVFGRIVARQAAEVLENTGTGSVLEFGAGTGRLAIDVLMMLEALGTLPERYRILEVSPDLAQRQKDNLAAAVPHLMGRVEWLSGLPVSHAGVVLANEVLDAMPVERFERTRDGVLQQRVMEKQGRFCFTTGTAPELLVNAVKSVEKDIGRTLAPGFVSEISLGPAGWIADLAQVLERGCVLLFDYGGTRQEYYAEDRADGWLRCHFRHHAHDDPLVLAGIQDITAWVDFTALAGAAVDHGFRIGGYQSQAHFIAGGGLEREFQEFDQLSETQQLAMSTQIKTLTLPGEMGENIKCLGLLKGPVVAPSAFLLGDRTHTL